MKNKNRTKLKTMDPEIGFNNPLRGIRRASLRSLSKRGHVPIIVSSVGLGHAMCLGAARLAESLSRGLVQEFKTIQHTGLTRHALVVAVGILGNSERRVAEFLTCTTMPLSR